MSSTAQATTTTTTTSTSANPQVYASASLYVGDLNTDVTEAILFDHFSTVGAVASVRVCRDASTRRSLGYAYVNFHRVEDAERALDTMNFSAVKGRNCRIMWSHRDPQLRKSGLGNIFVKNLDKSIDNKALYDTFSVFGNILSCKVATNTKRDSLGYGFVHYETEDSATQAIKNVNGMVIAGQSVSVMPFKSRKERGGQDPKSKYTNIYVKFLPDDITKETLETLFSKFGKITSSVLRTSEYKEKKPKKENKENKETKDDSKISKVYAFINYETADQASAAVDGMKGFEYKGRALLVTRAQKKEEREKELREKFEAMKAERQKKFAGVNLFIKNLADSVDDARLLKEFSNFGSITSAKVMRDDKGKSRGFGFVCFKEPEEATRAVTAMNNTMLESKPLYVALHQRKEIRRRQLEQQYEARAKMGGMPLYPNAPLYYQSPFPNPQQMGNQRFYQPMPVRRFNPNQQQQQQNMGPNPMMMNNGMMQQRPPMYLMPVNGQNQRNPNMTMQPRRGRGRGGKGMQTPLNGQGRGRGMQQGQGQQTQQGNTQNVRYQNNVQNVRQNTQSTESTTQQHQQQQQNSSSSSSTSSAPITLKELASAPPEQQKQIIGERLFPLIHNQQPDRAGKITGMLLEMDNGELLHLLENNQALAEKITEANNVLDSSPSEEGEQEPSESS